MMTMSESTNKVQIDDAHSRIFLLAILLSGIVTMLNTSTVTISLPTYMSVFHVDINTVQWVVTGYMLPLGMVMPLSEDFLDKYFSSLDADKIAHYQLFSEKFFIRHYAQMDAEIVLTKGKNEWRKKENRSSQLDVFLRLKGVKL